MRAAALALRLNIQSKSRCLSRTEVANTVRAMLKRGWPSVALAACHVTPQRKPLERTAQHLSQRWLALVLLSKWRKSAPSLPLTVPSACTDLYIHKPCTKGAPNMLPNGGSTKRLM